MHIHPISPKSDSSSDSVEDSAAKRIQAGFRGYRVRKQLSHKSPRTTYKMESSNVNGNNNKSIQDQTTIEDRCATKIQAGVRGFLVRKKQKKVEEAATKIQAGFRGFKARKEVQRLKEN